MSNLKPTWNTKNIRAHNRLEEILQRFMKNLMKKDENLGKIHKLRNRIGRTASGYEPANNLISLVKEI